jgi:hypothetical protein
MDTMTNPQIEFIDCNLEEMRAQFSRHASNILPFRDFCPGPIKRRIANIQGKLVIASQDFLYYNSEMNLDAWITRLFFAEGDPADFPLIFRVGNKVHVLSDW